MAYEIKITQRREVVRKAGKEWAQVGTKEVARDDRFTSAEGAAKTRTEPTFGYTPEIEKTVPEEREVFSQIVDELDLPAVVKAINKL